MHAPQLCPVLALLIVTAAGGFERVAAAQSTTSPPGTGAGGAEPQPEPTTETNPGAMVPFLEGTDVFWSIWARDSETWFPYKLEADIFPHLVVAQDFTSLIDPNEIAKRQQGSTRGLKEFAYSISGTPAVRIRMLRDVSAPVRTPSYMPRVNVQFLWARDLKYRLERALEALRKQRAGQAPGAAEAADRTPGADTTSTENPFANMRAALATLTRVSIWEAHLIVGHHSNGQDGCTSASQQRDPPRTGECLPRGVVPTRETVNRHDGSFSTNYLRIGVNYSRNFMSKTHDLQADREARARVEFEWHPRKAVDEDIVDVYGRARLLLGGAYAKRNVGVCRKRLEGSAGVVWNPGVVEGVPESSWTFQVSCFPTPNGGWGIFARFYTGQDYYNIGFLDGITRFHVGATFNQSDFFRFARKATPRG